MRTLVLLLLGAVFVAAEPRNQQRIVGGTTTTITQYPYMAALLWSPTGTIFPQNCGGSIITTTTILSAAHCFIGDTERNWRIRVGSTYANSGGTVFATSRIIRHPSYSQFSHNHDVALLKAQGTFVLGTNVQLGVIAGGNYILPDNSVVWAAGWGHTTFGGVSSEQLRHVQVWTVNQDVCRSRYGSVITDNMLCSGWLDVGGRDQCQGDSGGPLLHNNVIVGITSFGRDCALAYYPGVNARVSRYTSWIQSNA